jgi:hypothetical protein
VSEAAAKARVFSPVAVLWMVVIGVVSLGAWLVLSAYAPELRRDDDPRAHALSRSAIGFAGLRELLTARGDTVVVSRSPRRRPHGLLILTPGVGTDDKAVERLGFEAPELVILPKWNAIPDPMHPGWVQRADGDDLIPLEVMAKGLPGALLGGLRIERRVSVRPRAVALVARAAPFPTGQILRAGPIESLQTAFGQGWIPVLVDEAERPVLLRRADRALYVLTDPDLMNTHGLASFDTAQTALAVLDALRGPDTAVVQDVTLNGFTRARSILKLAFEPPFLGLTLSALAVALLMALHAAARFGPAQTGGRALALGAKALADNSAGLIRLARREPALAPAYAAQVRAAVARAVGAPRDLTGPDLDALLDRLARARGVAEQSSALTAAAQAVRTRVELMQLARSLNHWRTEMTRDRR